MAQSFIEKNIDNIMESKEFSFPLNLAMALTWVLGNSKGINLKILDMRDTTSLADYFILGSASNVNQAQAMANEIIAQGKRKNINIISKEGTSDHSDWILIDLGDVIVHIFEGISRELYDLDNLWDVSIIDIPNEYYSSSSISTDDDEEKGYF